ncbi:MAG: alpha/beta hydrolase [Candidatus Heimdallarchaeota archaeon]|nr:alpha/beta hydrolase [Candidatus Heimdallarchaeota archaeon]MBY8995011.1 alpha/beta hydrolase [Candidatus Heimdallarchaeota archaeon]
MHALTISFLVVSIILLIFFVIISFTFVGLFLSELGLWFSWIPLSFLIASIPFLILYSAELHPRLDFFFLIVSSLFNLISYFRLMAPFYRVNITNRRLRKVMKRSLGEDYLIYIDPALKSNIIKKVRFRLSHYFSGINYKRIEEQVTTIDNVIYKEVDKESLALNVYSPKKEGKYPIIIYIHGGGWMRGSKDRFLELRILKRLACMGFVVFNIDYRLAPLPNLQTFREIPHDNPTIREMVSDVRASILFVTKNASKYNGDPKSLFLFGRSAGAHLALLTAFSCEEKFFDMEGINCTIHDFDINGVIAFYPATDLVELDKFYGEGAGIIFKQSLYRSTGTKLEGAKSLYEIFSPISYVNEKNLERIPPVFLAAGSKDRIFDVYQSEELNEELQNLGLTSVLLELPWANHAFDAVINGPGGQLVFQYLSQFLVWAITRSRLKEIEEIVLKHGLEDILSIEKLSIIHALKQGKTEAEIANSFQKQKSEDNIQSKSK